jgi:hypothetical protein
MGMMDKVSATLHDLVGKKNADQVKGTIKDASAQVKEAATHVRDALKGH